MEGRPMKEVDGQMQMRSQKTMVGKGENRRGPPGGQDSDYVDYRLRGVPKDGKTRRRNSKARKATP